MPGVIFENCGIFKGVFIILRSSEFPAISAIIVLQVPGKIAEILKVVKSIRFIMKYNVPNVMNAKEYKEACNSWIESILNSSENGKSYRIFATKREIMCEENPRVISREYQHLLDLSSDITIIASIDNTEYSIDDEIRHNRQINEAWDKTKVLLA